MTSPMDVIFFEQADYQTIYEEQKALVAKRIADAVPDTLMLGEHQPVITVGRAQSASKNILESNGVPVIEIERGGDVTYHGPGQVVVYPILKLREDQRDLHAYLRKLEGCVIETLKSYQIEGCRRQGATGVWVFVEPSQWRKIASMGIAVKQWVTYHGLALNVTTDVTAFQGINPCGFSADTMISMKDCTSEDVSVSDVRERLITCLQQTLSRNSEGL